MECLTQNFERIHVGFADDEAGEHARTEIPFHQFYATAGETEVVPRFLFRIFSRVSAGNNDQDWMRSEATIHGNTINIIDDEESHVAMALNEHLRWSTSRSFPDPFISWTTSLLFAIQYSIYKHRTEVIELKDVPFAVIDTTLFPNETFVQDLTLMKRFEDSVPNSHIIKIGGQSKRWSDRGLRDFRHFRSKKHTTLSGSYYFGEYLAQGQLCIKNRSSVMQCDKIVNENLYQLEPQFKSALSSRKIQWAHAVIAFREAFYGSDDRPAIEPREIVAATLISLNFPSRYHIIMMASLLALRPRQATDTGFIDRMINIYADVELRQCLSRETTIVAPAEMPEVVQFSHFMGEFYQKYYLISFQELIKSSERMADIAARIVDTPAKNLTSWLEEIDKVYVRRLQKEIVALRKSLRGRKDT
ncbi:hypothetical protein G7054_g14741 [Neopestalotiopsis clavispora]|nr:hypothetical protein G7054_g14741 [Neopestalotiopsis clavispora]